MKKGGRQPSTMRAKVKFHSCMSFKKGEVIPHNESLNLAATAKMRVLRIQVSSLNGLCEQTAYGVVPLWFKVIELTLPPLFPSLP